MIQRTTLRAIRTCIRSTPEVQYETLFRDFNGKVWRDIFKLAIKNENLYEVSNDY